MNGYANGNVNGDVDVGTEKGFPFGKGEPKGEKGGVKGGVKGLPKGKGGNGMAFDMQEMIRRLVKYLVEGLAVGVVGMALVLRKKKGNVNFNLQAREVSVMAVTAAAVFAILDMYAPSISSSARQGAGFGLGANLVGFPAMR